MMPRRSNKISVTPKIGIAVQGFGAHGAFAWGVLDSLLRTDLPITAMSGTSSGALNASFTASGLAAGDRHRASQALEKGWSNFARLAVFSPFRSNIEDHMKGTWPNLDNTYYNHFRTLVDKFTEAQRNPLQFNPIKKVIETSVDINLINSNTSGFRLFTNSINPKTMEHRITGSGALTVDAIAASCNLPEIMPKVLIDGALMWDGGYAENPCIEPLITQTDITDLIVIQLIPDTFNTVPDGSLDLLKRKIEIYQTAPLNRTLQSIEMINTLIDNGHLNPATSGMRKVNLHKIVRPEQTRLALSSLDNLAFDFLSAQHRDGLVFGQAWADEFSFAMGKTSTYASGKPAPQPRKAPRLTFD